jgi:tryptophan 2,3-dioxygenase
MQQRNLYRQALKWKEEGTITDEVVESLRDYDRNFNVFFPMIHLQTAHTYLGSGAAQTAATGGSHWEKYLHPKYQRRIFFPAFWTEEELANWGQSEAERDYRAKPGNEVAPGL